MQIKTGAVDASAPTAMGMVINLATRSGTDTWRGAFSAASTPRQWNGNNTPNGTSPISDSVQTDFSGGGPIVRGRAWFFVAERYANRKDGISRDDRQLSILQALQPSFAPFDNDAKAWISFVNASAVISPRHRVSGFFQDDRRTQGQNFQNNGGNFDRGQFGGEATGARLTSVWGDRDHDAPARVLQQQGHQHRRIDLRRTGQRPVAQRDVERRAFGRPPARHRDDRGARQPAVALAQPRVQADDQR